VQKAPRDAPPRGSAVIIGASDDDS
jgi:hypothetical protein